MDIVAAGLVDGGGVVLFEGQAEAVDSAEGSAEVVRDGVAEGFELAIDSLQLGGAERDPLFQRCVERTDLFGSLLGFGVGHSEAYTGDFCRDA